MVSAKISLVVLSAFFAITLARPGAPNYPTEEENVIPDYANDNDDDDKFAYVDRLKSVPVANPDKFYDEDVLETTAVPLPIESSTTAAPEINVSEAVEAVRAADVAGSVGAVVAVQVVEAVKAALETSETPETTTAYPTTFAVGSGRAQGSVYGERPHGDAPTPDQTFYGFSKFLHDLLQVPVQIMRSMSTYLTGAFNSRHEPPSSATTDDHALTSAMLAQSF